MLFEKSAHTLYYGYTKDKTNQSRAHTHINLDILAYTEIMNSVGRNTELKAKERGSCSGCTAALKKKRTHTYTVILIHLYKTNQSKLFVIIVIDKYKAES